MKEEFTSNDTKILKGVAIILMLMHHLWFIPERVAGGELNHLFNIFGQSAPYYLGGFGKICVSIFFFLGGYGLYISSKKKNVSIIDRLRKLYLNYWKVFVIFIPIGFIFFSNQIAYSESAYSYARFANFDMLDVTKNFFGISCTLNGEWWFLISYVFAIISFPLIKCIFDKNKAPINIFITVILMILVSNVFPTIGAMENLGNLNNNLLYYLFFCQSTPYIACFWMGMAFGKDDLLTKLKTNLKLNWIFDILIMIAVIFLRQSVLGEELDIVFVPLFIVAILDLIKKIPFVDKVFLGIGKESTSMWLIHSFYCYYFYFFVKLVVAPGWAVPSLLILIVLTYVTAFIVDYFWKGIGIILNKMMNYIYKPNKPKKLKAV